MGIIYGRVPGAGDNYTVVQLDGNGHMPASRPPNPAASGRHVVVASLTSVQLDFGAFGAERKMFTVFNDTQEGTLHIALGVPADVTDFDYKVPPQHCWELPASSYLWGGDIFGVWDVDDGFAQVVEMI